MSNKDRIGQALKSLNRGLYPYFEKMMVRMYSTEWDDLAKKHLPQYKNAKKRQVEDKLKEDTGALLTVISKEWNGTFKNDDHLDNGEKGIVEELIQVRHDWAHRNNFEFSNKDTERALDGMVRLLKAVGAEEKIIEDLEQQQKEVFDLLIREKRYQKNRQISIGESKARKGLTELLKKFPFQDASLLNDALTHRSYLYENPREVNEDNELLEFLGDSILNFLSGEYLYQKYKEYQNEGDLTRLRSALVDNQQLAKFSEQLEIGRWVRLGKGATLNVSLLSNTFEAIIGAYFLDSGMESVRQFVRPLFDSVIEEISVSGETEVNQVAIDPKNQLQQWVHQYIGPITPKYHLVKEEGPDHAKQFTVQVAIGGKVVSTGEGASKKEASRKAAENALLKLFKQ